MPAKKKKRVKREPEKKKKRVSAAVKRQRSDAAKRGWKTRRKNARVRVKRSSAADKKRQIKQLEKVVGTKKSKAKKPKRGKPRRKRTPEQSLNAKIRERDEHIRKLERELHQRIQETMTQGWVRAQDIGLIRQNGALAKFPSQLRHMGETSTHVRKELLQAKAMGESMLRYVATRWADYFEVNVREVYTLLYSP